MKKKYSKILLLIFFSLLINSKIFAEIKFKEVVVTGIGQSLDEATNNAFAEAISMVNGKNVQTKTIIKVLSGEPLPKEPESQGENANFFAKILVQLTDSSKQEEDKPEKKEDKLTNNKKGNVILVNSIAKLNLISSSRKPGAIR